MTNDGSGVVCHHSIPLPPIARAPGSHPNHASLHDR